MQQKQNRSNSGIIMDQSKLTSRLASLDTQPMDSEDEHSPVEEISADNPEEDQNLLFYKIFSNDLVRNRNGLYQRLNYNYIFDRLIYDFHSYGTRFLATSTPPTSRQQV